MAFPKLLVADNTDAREEVLSHKLLFDLKIAAATRDYHLLSYYSDVDHDGFDVILDDRDSLRKLQLKSVYNAAKSTWDIHKGLLRPSLRTWGQFGFSFGASSGVEGGVILIDVHDRDGGFDLTYCYTDIYFISLVAAGVIPKPSATVQAASRVRKALQTGSSIEKVKVPRGLFITAKDPSAVLALVGLHSIYGYLWQDQAIPSIRQTFDMSFDLAKLATGETEQAIKNRAVKALTEANGGQPV